MKKEGMHIVIVHENKEVVSAFVSALEANPKIQMSHAASAKAALESVDFQKVDAVAVSDSLSDSTGKEFVEQLMKKNPMINTAVFSEMESDDFHEYTEGLGVLMQLPLKSGAKEAESFMERMRKIDFLIDMKK